jgi:hypothetical protein
MTRLMCIPHRLRFRKRGEPGIRIKTVVGGLSQRTRMLIRLAKGGTP